MNKLYTFTDAQRILGVTRPSTITDLVDSIGLTTQPVPRKGNSRGLTEQDLKVLRRRLRRRLRRLNGKAAERLTESVGA